MLLRQRRMRQRVGDRHTGVRLKLVCVSVIRIKKDEVQCFCASDAYASGYGVCVSVIRIKR